MNPFDSPTPEKPDVKPALRFTDTPKKEPIRPALIFSPPDGRISSVDTFGENSDDEEYDFDSETPLGSSYHRDEGGYEKNGRSSSENANSRYPMTYSSFSTMTPRVVASSSSATKSHLPLPPPLDTSITASLSPPRYTTPTRRISLSSAPPRDSLHNKRYILLETLPLNLTSFLYLFPYIFLFMGILLDTQKAISQKVTYATPVPASNGVVEIPLPFVPYTSPFIKVDLILSNVELSGIPSDIFVYSSIIDGDESSSATAKDPHPLLLTCHHEKCIARVAEEFYEPALGKLLPWNTRGLKVVMEYSESDFFSSLGEHDIVYRVAHESRFFSLLERAVRFTTWLGTIFALYYFRQQVHAYEKAVNPDFIWFLSPYVVIPERRYVPILLISLTLMLNPVLVFFPFFFPESDPLPPTLVSSSLYSFGVIGYLFVWLCLVEGLRYHSGEAVKKRHRQQQAMRDTDETIAHINENTSLNTPQKRKTARRLSSHTLMTHTHLVLRHDMFGEFSDFFLEPKIRMLVVSVGVLCIVVISCFEGAGVGLGGGVGIWGNAAFVICSAGQVIVLGTWLVWILSSSIETRLRLRTESFISTRYAQLAHRVLENLLLIAVLIVLIPTVINVLQFFETDGDGVGGDFKRIMLAMGRVSARLSSSKMGPGKNIYLFVCTIIVGAIFLPPEESEGVEGSWGGKNKRRNYSRFVINLTTQTHTFGIFPLLREIGVDTADMCPPIFCNEIACWLCECSWQSYYSSFGFGIDQFAPGKMNLSSVGLKLVAETNDKATDTHGFVCCNVKEIFDGEVRGRGDVIAVFFRGSVTFENFKTDLDTEQVGIRSLLLKPHKTVIDLATGEVSTRTSSSPAFSLDNYDSSDDEGDFVSNHSAGNSNNLLTFDCPHNVLCHQGFLSSYLSVREEMLAAVLSCFTRTALKNSNNRKKFVVPKVYICGHSLGGALAQLFALDLAMNYIVKIDRETANLLHSTSCRAVYGRGAKGPQSISCRIPICNYTFGQPRVGNRHFANLFNRLVPHSFRVCVEGDFFTSVPKYTLRHTYKHGGGLVVLDESENGNLIVNPNAVEKAFRFNRSQTSVANHALEVYRNCLESVFETEELRAYYSKGFHNNVFAPKIDIESAIRDVRDSLDGSQFSGISVGDFSGEKKKEQTTLESMGGSREEEGGEDALRGDLFAGPTSGRGVPDWVLRR